MTNCSKSTFFAMCLFLILNMEAAARSTHSADYYFRPTNLAMLDSWNNDLSFTVSNPSKMPIVLKLTAQPVGILQTRLDQMPNALTVFPTTMIVMPGERKKIRLDYMASDNSPRISSYEVAVEQLPILYASPGSSAVLGIMEVTRYIADVEVRENGTAKRQYAVNSFEKRSDDVKQRAIASIQPTP